MMSTIVYIPPRCEKLLKKARVTKEELTYIKEELSHNPEVGSLVADTGGVRKIRFASPSKNKGKRGGYRVITFFRAQLNMPVIMLDIYSKADKKDLTPKEKQELKRITEEFVSLYKNK